MGVSIPPMSSRTFALSMAFANNSLFLTTPNRMGLLRGRTGPLLGWLELCCMTKTCRYLWKEACSTAVYLQSRSPHRAVGSRTPEEAFTGVRPDVGHFKMFGCLTFSHVPSKKRTKLEPTAKKGIFVVTTRLRRPIAFTSPHNVR